MTKNQANGRTPDDVIAGLRVRGVPEQTLQALKDDINEDAPDFSHSCTSCGRFATSILRIKDEGELLYSAPEHIAYCYRDGRPHGICFDCFSAGRFGGLSDLELQYFRDCFSCYPK